MPPRLLPSPSPAPAKRLHPEKQRPCASAAPSVLCRAVPRRAVPRGRARRPRPALQHKDGAPGRRGPRRRGLGCGRWLRVPPRGRSAGAGRGGSGALPCPPRARRSGSASPAAGCGPDSWGRAAPGQSHWGWEGRGKKRPALGPPPPRSPFLPAGGLRGPRQR